MNGVTRPRGGLAPWQKRRVDRFVQGTSGWLDQIADAGSPVRPVGEPFRTRVQAVVRNAAAPLPGPATSRVCEAAALGDKSRAL